LGILSPDEFLVIVETVIVTAAVAGNVRCRAICDTVPSFNARLKVCSDGSDVIAGNSMSISNISYLLILAASSATYLVQMRHTVAPLEGDGEGRLPMLTPSRG